MNMQNQANLNPLKKIDPVLMAIALIAALLLWLSAATVAKITAANPRELWQLMRHDPETVQFISKRSPFFISLLVKPERLQTFSQLATNPSDRAKLRRQLDFFKQQLQQNWLLEYERDIQPWLDQEMTIANVSLEVPKYLLAMTAKDRQGAQQGLERFWQRLAIAGWDLGFEQYQGVVITKVLPPDQYADRPTIFGAALGKFVIFAQDGAVLRDAIDNLRSPSLTIAGLDSYRDRLAQIHQSPAAKGSGKKSIGNVAIAYGNWQNDFTSAAPKTPTNFLLGLRLERDRLIVSSFFESRCSQIDNSAPSADLSCLQGEYNLQVAPNSNLGGNLRGNLGGNLGSNLWQHFDWLLTAQVKPDQIPSIAALDAIASNYFTVGNVAIGDQPATVWTELITNSTGVSGKVMAVHAQTANQILFSNSLTAIATALNQAKF